MRKAWLYFFIILLAGGVVWGARVWVGKDLPPSLTLPTEGEGINKKKSSSPLVGEARRGEEVLPSKTLLDVPFTAQAPLREWKDPRQQDACEEAAILMAAHWIRNEPFESAQKAKEEILALSHYQEENYQDTSAVDTAKLFKNYFGYEAKVVLDIGVLDIKRELAKGNLVIVPANGQALHNPYYTPPGPERHNLLIIGYDDATQEFITNDAGIMRGAGYRYPEKIVGKALRDYPSGHHQPIEKTKRLMLVIIKPL